jgi:hypothetical protein
MDYFAGLSVKETSVCILDDAGKIVREVKMAVKDCSTSSSNPMMEEPWYRLPVTYQWSL